MVSQGCNCSCTDTEKNAAQWHPCKMSLGCRLAPVLTQWLSNRRVECFPLLRLGKRSRFHASGSVCSCVFFIPDSQTLNSHHCLCHTMQRGLLEELWSTVIMFSKTSEQKYWYPALPVSPFYTLFSWMQTALMNSAWHCVTLELHSPWLNCTSQALVTL